MEEENVVTIETYQKLAMRTCLPTAKNRTYAMENYFAEFFELLAKIKSFHAKKIRDGRDFDEFEMIDRIKDEIGDCFWQLALCCQIEKLKFKDVFCSAPISSGIQAPDDVIQSIDCQVLYRHIGITKIQNEMSRVLAVCTRCNINPIECLQRNIQKLASRAQRNVLKGSGDNR